MATEDGRKVEGLLIDWGGVMTSDVFTAFADFGRREGIPADAVAQLFRTDPVARELLVGLETGTTAEPEFEERFARLLGVPSDGLIGRMLGELRPDPRMCAAVTAVRSQGVPTGLVSNSWGLSGYPADLLDELFTGTVISGTVGVRKPSPEIYLLGARSLGLRPDQCVFVDDLPGNLAPARDLGMATVHHTGAERTIAALADLLAVNLVTW